MRCAAAAVALGAAAAAAAAGNCSDYYAGGGGPSAAWCRSGGYFPFRSPRNAGREIQLFWRCGGDPTHPAVVYSHGFPTSSADLRKVAALVEQDLYVCAVDYPGFGFSDKPSDKSFVYSLFDYAEALHQLVVNHTNITEFTFLTHDMGDSVGLRFLQAWDQRGRKPYKVKKHIVMNGGVYLPLTNITEGQKLMLSNVTGPALEKIKTGTIEANGMSGKVYSPSLDDAEAADLAAVLDYQGGTHVMHGTIQYLVERKEFEDDWLQAWAASPVPCEIVWGDQDPIATETMIRYVYDNFLRNRTAPIALHMVPGASHYIQVGYPEVIAQYLLNATRA